MKRTALRAALAAAAANPIATAPQGPAVLRVTALANGEAELLIYGFIGESFFGESTAAADVVRELSELSASTIQVRLNSQGGSVQDGIAIYNALRRHPARVVITVDGQACSIASLILQAGDERVMAANTIQMLHAPSAWLGGNAVQLREQADMLDVWSRSMLSSYIAKAPDKAAEIEAALTDGRDHYFSAAESVAFGIADRVLETAAADVPDAAAAAAALLGYVQSIAHAAAPVQACLRTHIQAAATAPVFAALPADSQRAVFAHIEDPQMKKQFSAIMAAAAGAPPAVPSPTSPTPAAPAAPTAVAPAPAAPVAPASDPMAAPVAPASDPMAALAARNEAIRAAFAGFHDVSGVVALESAMLADPRLTVEAAQGRLLTHVAAHGQPLRPNGPAVAAGTDESERLRDAGVDMLMARSGLLPQAEAERARQGNPFGNATLIDMAERALIRAGVNTRDLSRDQIASRVLATQTTSDFPVLLENTLHRMLLTGYRLTPFTWSRFCAVGTLSDYRPHNRYSLSSFSDLKGVNEAGEYEGGVLGDGAKETIQGARKGRLLTITPEVLVNDDLGAFSRIAVALGQAAGRTIEKDVYATLAKNGGLGPTMQDGKSLFHADHNNIAATPAAPSVDAWDAARQLLGTQMDPGSNDYLDIVPALWLGPLSLGTKARTINQSEFNPDVSSKYAPVNTSRGMVRDVIDTPRLSGTAWMLFADPAIEPVIEVAFLDGVQTPTIAQETNFRTDGLTWKVSHRYGVGGVGWRGAIRNAGA